MATGFNYTSFSNTLATMMVIDTANDPDWATYLPAIIDGAELRILRELDLMVARKSESTTLGNSPTASFNARIGVPPDLVVLREFGYYTPAGKAADSGGKWNQLLQASASFLREYWPDRSITGAPVYFSLLDNSQVLLVPTPDAPYAVEMFMTYRPATLSATTATTWISVNLPDLFLYAAAVVACGYLNKYGALTDDPQAGTTWENLYQKYLVTARNEEMRRKGEGVADNSQTLPPMTTPS